MRQAAKVSPRARDFNSVGFDQQTGNSNVCNLKPRPEEGPGAGEWGGKRLQRKLAATARMLSLAAPTLLLARSGTGTSACTRTRTTRGGSSSRCSGSGRPGLETTASTRRRYRSDGVVVHHVRVCA